MKHKDIAAAVERGIAKRRRREQRFKTLGIGAIVAGLVILSLLFLSIAWQGVGAFKQTQIALDIHFDPAVIDPQGERDAEKMAQANYLGLVKKSLREDFPAVSGRRNKKALYSIMSTGSSFQLKDMVLENPDIIGKTERVWLIADDDVDMYEKYFSGKGDQSGTRLKENQIGWLEKLRKEDRVQQVFNMTFFTAGDSREPELAGIYGALWGSIFTLIVTLVLSFTIGVAAAIYLEEFAPKNRLTYLIEVNVNNLAAVPSIVFGLLGLAVFINFFGLPRSAPLVGGLVLTLMTLPTIIIASRAALKSVPPSIREAALGLGASKMQAIFHHIVPLAMPGMLTGAIVGMAQALGETAPLLMIGMVAFIVDVPGGLTDPASVLPVQIFLWADSPERGFLERTSAAILVLLAFLILMNLAAIWMRKKFERRW